MKTQPKYYIETDVLEGIECSDDGRWYNYSTFIGEGDSFDEVCESCSGFKQDQDGGEGPEVMLDDLPAALCNRVVADIRRQFEEREWPTAHPSAECDRTCEDGSDREYPGGDS